MVVVGGGGSESVPVPGLLSFLPAGAGPLPFLAGGDSLPLPLAAGGASLPLPLAAGGASLPLAASGASLPLAAGRAFLLFTLVVGGASLPLPLAADAGTLSVLMAGSLETLPPAAAANTTVAMDWVAEVLAWVLITLARREGLGDW
ncbi:hypothetical protein NDU88_003266 [Pleurodeles waltl]|uniref:Uncharacterized protein n=1 Tax=Pleurodeles waltl TaxID=8319 RepID=A0AAV7KUE7_PLEWA|nr:hypothetical protein NDU88_003266 [Pleurodeles waltl]